MGWVGRQCGVGGWVDSVGWVGGQCGVGRQCAVGG